MLPSFLFAFQDVMQSSLSSAKEYVDDETHCERGGKTGNEDEDDDHYPPFPTRSIITT